MTEELPPSRFGAGHSYGHGQNPSPPPDWRPAEQIWPQPEFGGGPGGGPPRESRGRSWIWVAVTVVVCVTIGGGLAVFLTGRDDGRSTLSRSETAGPPSGVTDDTISSMTFPIGTCGNSERGWYNTVPITVTDGDGEALTASGEFGGASIRGATLAGWLDADADGTEDAVVRFVCFGSTFDMCCAGRSSSLEFVRVFDFSDAASPQPLGDTIMPGSSPVRGETYGESRMIEQVRVEDSAIITEETLIYADTSGATADLEHAPDATIEVTHRFTGGEWTSTERVIG